MKKLLAGFTFVVAGLMAGCGGANDKDKGCAVDIDCPGDLICVQALCVQGEFISDMGTLEMTPADMSSTDMSTTEMGPESDMPTPDMGPAPDVGSTPDMNVEVDMAPDMQRCANAPTAAISARVQNTVQYTSTSLNAGVEQVVELTGANSSDPNNSTLTYQWTHTSSPVGSQPEVMPDEGEATFKTDTEGTYTIELWVENAQGVMSCNVASFDIVVGKAGPGITYIITWDTPSVANPVPDMGADVDIHYMDKVLGEWNTGSYDIYWRNTTADWGAAGPPNDAVLSKDSRSSFSGEIVHHPMPEDRVYSFGVHYYDDRSFGPSYATLQLYVDGQLKHEQRDQFLQSRGQFWYAIDYDVANDTVTQINQITNGFPNASP